MKWLKRLFCKHEFVFEKGYSGNTEYFVIDKKGHECKKCGKLVKFI